jgi:hypothetical protein
MAINNVSNKPFHKFVEIGFKPKPPPINQIITGKDNNHVTDIQGLILFENFLPMKNPTNDKIVMQNSQILLIVCNGRINNTS